MNNIIANEYTRFVVKIKSSDERDFSFSEEKKNRRKINKTEKKSSKNETPYTIKLNKSKWLHKIIDRKAVSLVCN